MNCQNITTFFIINPSSTFPPTHQIKITYCKFKTFSYFCVLYLHFAKIVLLNIDQIN